MWVRGLKLDVSHEQPLKREVAPRVGAWIETITEDRRRFAPLSHPVWVRGLKHSYKPKKQNVAESHPVWVRGLKHQHLLTEAYQHLVAPRVGAWIETR